MSTGPHGDEPIAPSIDATRPSTPGTSTGAPAGFTPGSIIAGRYRLVALLGRGGMGEVYRADDLTLGQPVALKFLPAGVASDGEQLARLHNELKIARQVSHKNVCRLYDLGEADGRCFLTMEYIDGEDLASLVRRIGRVPQDKAIDVARQLCAGVAAAHERGVLHRDLKPANVMIDGNGDVRITDFGLAVAAGDATAVRAGTPLYMAPEQLAGQPASVRSDIFALGLVLFEVCTGRRTYEAKTINDLVRLHESGRVTHPSKVVAELNPAIERVILRCLETDPAKRYQKIEELTAALDRLDAKSRPVPKTRVGLPLVLALVTLLLAIAGGLFWYSRRSIPQAPHDPVSVVIADIENRTGDQTFDRTLEPMLRIVLEGATFISAYDRNGIIRSLGVRPPEILDERTALELSVKQGVGVVLSGSLERQRSGYAIAIKATHAVTGNVIVRAEKTAANKDQVLGAATELATTVREALGDDTPDADKRFAMEMLSATSLEVVREFAKGANAMSSSQFDEALQSFTKAVALDPKFGLGYAGMASASRNLDKQQDAEKYIKEAIRHLDGMTERERFRTRGTFYMITNDAQACVNEFGHLVARYAADASARNNRALCLTFLRKTSEAVEEMRAATKILPQRTLYRVNLALYADYSGDFQTAEREVRALQEPGLFALLALAYSQLLQNQPAQAVATYETLGKLDQQGASYKASGLADLAIYEGRFSDAARMFEQGAAADLAANDPDRAAAKFAALANAHVALQQKGPALAAAQKALASSQAVKIRFLAARAILEAGDLPGARALAAGLASMLEVEPQAYAKIIDGDAALKDGEVRQAIKAFTEANALLDTWIGHFDLGRAYLEAGAFAQADSEFDRCSARRGEALALFLDEEPSYGYFPPVYYYQGRVREELKSAGFADSYRSYLAIRGASTEDPLLPDVRRRAGR